MMALEGHALSWPGHALSWPSHALSLPGHATVAEAAKAIPRARGGRGGAGRSRPQPLRTRCSASLQGSAVMALEGHALSWPGHATVAEAAKAIPRARGGRDGAGRSRPQPLRTRRSASLQTPTFTHATERVPPGVCDDGAGGPRSVVAASCSVVAGSWSVVALSCVRQYSPTGWPSFMRISRRNTSGGVLADNTRTLPSAKAASAIADALRSRCCSSGNRFCSGFSGS